MVLVDSSVWIALLRAQAGPAVDCLRRLLWDGEAVLAPVIVQEILQGAASPPQLERLQEHFTGLPVLRSRDPLATHAAAGALYARWPLGRCHATQSARLSDRPDGGGT